jgi:glutaredoxin 3
MFKMYTTETCGYCKRAKELLAAKKLPVMELTIGVNTTKDQLLTEVPGALTVPQIFYNGTYVGGYDDLVEWLKHNDPNKFLAG